MADSERTTAFTNVNVPQNYQELLEPVVFQPWAEKFVEFADVTIGQSVLDIASGTGVVARAVAGEVGPAGRVVASDVSRAMLDVTMKTGSNGAEIETLESPATQLALPDNTFDRAFNHQGLPFIQDRVGAMREMRRVLKDGGIGCVAVWKAGVRCEPFETYIDVLRELEVSPPFPAAYDMASYTMGEKDVAEAFDQAGFNDVEIRTETLELSWPDTEAAVDGLRGTPFGPVVANLDADKRQQVIQTIAERFASDGPVKRQTESVFARGVARH